MVVMKKFEEQLAILLMLTCNNNCHDQTLMAAGNVASIFLAFSIGRTSIVLNLTYPDTQLHFAEYTCPVSPLIETNTERGDSQVKLWWT